MNSPERKRQRRRLVEGEFEGLSLGDPRRAARGVALASRLATRPAAGLPVAMGDRAMLEGVYRHLSSNHVKLPDLLEPHLALAAQRVAKAKTAYAISDTTACIFSGDAEREGLGTVGVDDQGFLAHVTLAVSSDGNRIPLGVLAVEPYVRTEKKGQRDSTARKADDKRESLRWARGMDAAAARVGETAELIHVADREGDIYELLSGLREKNRRFIIRSAQDRCVEALAPEDADRLFEAARKLPPVYSMEVPLSPRKGHEPPSKQRTFPARKGRTAQLTFAARSVVLVRPKRCRRSFPETLTVNIVHVFEVGMPPGQAPVEWLLLTTEPISSQAEIQSVVEGYRARWTIEEYFKAVKSGCAFEQRQLESAHALVNLFAYTLVVAYALLLMRALSRTGTDIPASEVLTDEQILVLHLYNKKVTRHPTLREALLAIAALGGHLKNNGDPGWKTLSLGWQELLNLVRGFTLARSLMGSVES